MSDILDKFELEADQLAERADRDEAAIGADANLSDEGKRARLAAVGAEYARAADVLQYRAGEMVRVDLEDAQEELAAALAKAAKAERDALGGPGVALDLLRLEVGALGVTELVALAEGARDAWERAAHPRLVALELGRRLNAAPEDKLLRDALRTVQALAPAPDPAVKELQDKIAGLKGSDWRIRNLNRRAFNARIRELIR